MSHDSKPKIENLPEPEHELTPAQTEETQGGGGTAFTLGIGMPALDSQRITSTVLVNNENAT
jgi:hypothetical protein